MVQEPSAGMDPPVKTTLVLPALAARVPPHVVLPLPDTSTPVGNRSVSGEVRLAMTAAGLFKVMVKVETPPARMVAALNALFTVGGAFAGAVAVRVATAGTTLPPLLVCNAPVTSELI